MELASAQHHALQVLVDEFDLAACTMYSLEHDNAGLVLRSQVGFSYRDYDDFSLDLDSMAGEPIKSGKVKIIESLGDAKGFRDQNLIKKYQLRHAAVIPVALGNVPDQEFSISICLYPKNSETLATISKHSVIIQKTLNKLIASSICQTTHELRRQLIGKAMSVTDHYSFLHKALYAFTNWGFEAGSFFLYDERADCLRLAATTGLQDKRVRKTDAYYRMNETDHLTVQAYLTKSPQLIEVTELARSLPKFREVTSSPFRSAMAFPFFSPLFSVPNFAQKNKCFGVLRLTNKVVTHNDHHQTANFSWEDRLIVNYFLDLCSVVIHMFKRVEAKTNEFERVVHSLENNVLTVLGALHNIDGYTRKNVLFPNYISHSLPNSLAFMQSLHEQIRVFKTRDERSLPTVELSSTNLFGDVISKLPDYIASVARCYSAPGYHVSIDDFTKTMPARSNPALTNELAYMQIPRVLTDTELLLTVFKNLVENSVKYSQPAKEAKIKISWEAEAEYVSLFFWDNGIGIPEEDAEYIFNETYQAENAMRRRTSGAGIGLYQCKFIMNYLKGSVEYAKGKTLDEYRTCFIVKIPRFGD